MWNYWINFYKKIYKDKLLAIRINIIILKFWIYQILINNNYLYRYDKIKLNIGS